MTNKERAELIKANRSDIPIADIERALDEVEKRVWMEAHAAGYKAGMERGQKEMQERCVKFADQATYKPNLHQTHDEIVEGLRALPINGEQ